MGGFSKAYAMTGWRVGYVCAPSEILEGILKVHQYVIMSAPTIAQDAALEALKTGEPDVAADGRPVRPPPPPARRRLQRHRPARPSSRGAPSTPSRRSPRTGLDERRRSPSSCCEEESVAVVPGTAFGAAGEGHVRCCYATSYEALQEALVRIERFVERHRAPA